MPVLAIRNALVCDGSGAEPFLSDVFVRDGVIAAIGRSCAVHPDSEYDAHGLMLSPGFIDVHAHSDASVLAAPEAFGKISQGVTTEISGNCGLSAFPVATPEVKEHLEGVYSAYDVKITWSDFSSYASAINACRPAVNTMFLCGHNTLRANVLGYEKKSGTPADREKMREMLSSMLRQGAAGLSTGLLYIPGKFAPPEELFTIAGALKEHGGVYATHMRSEGDELIEAVNEALEITRRGSGRLEVSHMKTALERNWHKLGDYFAALDSGRAEGLKITADRYPYTYGQTSLSVILPPPYDAMTDAKIRAVLREDPSKVPAFAADIEKLHIPWHGILLCSGNPPEIQNLFGCRFDDAARALGVPPHELCAKLMYDDAPGVMAAFGGLSPDNMREILSKDFVCCGSDETARPRDYSIGRSHPRGFGAFPEFFNIVKSMYGVAEAVRRMTSLPAGIFGIRGRGLVREGYAADLVLFDPDKFSAGSSYGNPHVPANGLYAVWVNGVKTFGDGRVTGRAGSVITDLSR